MKAMIKRRFCHVCCVLLCMMAVGNVAARPVVSHHKKGGACHTVTKPITGTWVNIAYKDVRNKYTNPLNIDNTDPELWKENIRNLHEMGVDYLVIMEVANEGKAYYPSHIMPPGYDVKKKSPVETIIDEAGRLGMHVFMSTGWAKSQFDNNSDPFVIKRQSEIMNEVAALYGKKKSFYGWYLPVEDCLCPILEDHAVEAVNSLVRKSLLLTPGKKTLISPYGIVESDFDDPRYESQLAKLKVDIIAYQDEVGCVREKYPLPRLRNNWKRLRDIHNRLGIEMWANIETFTWEKNPNDRESALIPASYPRILAQQVAATEGGVDRIISFIVNGMIQKPNSKFMLGQPVWAEKLYNDYTQWQGGSYYWRMMDMTMSGTLRNNIPEGARVQGGNNNVIDGKQAEEISSDPNWVKFHAGYNEIVIDMSKTIDVRDVMVRFLNCDADGFSPAAKTCLYLSDDGKAYSLEGILNSDNYPFNKLDTWIDGTLFQNIGKKARFLKIAFYGDHEMGVDEIYVNAKD